MCVHDITCTTSRPTAHSRLGDGNVPTFSFLDARRTRVSRDDNTVFIVAHSSHVGAPLSSLSFARHPPPTARENPKNAFPDRCPVTSRLAVLPIRFHPVYRTALPDSPVHRQSFFRVCICCCCYTYDTRHDGSRAALRRSRRRCFQELRRQHLRARRLTDDRPVVYHVSDLVFTNVFVFCFILIFYLFHYFRHRDQNVCITAMRARARARPHTFSKYKRPLLSL